MPYAVIQIGYPVYGVGETKEDAINDAKKQFGKSLEIQTDVAENMMLFQDALSVGATKYGADCCLVECTETFMDLAQEGYDCIEWSLNEQGLICMPTERDHGRNPLSSDMGSSPCASPKDEETTQ